MGHRILNISTSPHLTKGLSTNKIMQQVVIALLPSALFSIYAFGLNALLQILTGITVCVGTEHFLSKMGKGNTTVGDWSATITGLIYALILPPGFPLWMNAIGGFIAIALGKFAFGGLGHNAFNPALVGRAVLQAAFPVAITTWLPSFEIDRFSVVSTSVLALPFMEPVFDTVSGATPLSSLKFNNITTPVVDLALGSVPGSTGETSALMVILGGVYLISKNLMNWRIPVALLTTVSVLSAIAHWVDPAQYPSTGFMLFSGGLMFGAIFMATDMVGSPITHLGAIIYAIFIGIIVVAIRLWGGLPEGVMYAILLGNAVSPHIDQLIKNRVYGTR